MLDKRAIQILVFNFAIASLGGSLLLSGCGSENSKANPASKPNTTPAASAPAAAVPGAAACLSGRTPSDVTPILTYITKFVGTFKGTITQAAGTDLSSSPKAYILTIGQTAANSQNYFYANFSGTGANNTPILFCDYLHYTGYQNGVGNPNGDTTNFGPETIINFMTNTDSPLSNPALTSDNFTLALSFALTQNGNFDPAQSAISINDCGLYQDCSESVLDAGFGSFGKAQ